MAEKAFVTGITGFVGSHLAKALLDRGYEVVGLTRDFNKKKALYRLGIEDRVVLVNGDICDKDLLKRILTQYNIRKVFHMKWLIRPVHDSRSYTHKNNVKSLL